MDVIIYTSSADEIPDMAHQIAQTLTSMNWFVYTVTVMDRETNTPAQVWSSEESS